MTHVRWQIEVLRLVGRCQRWSEISNRNLNSQNTIGTERIRQLFRFGSFG